MRLLPALVMVLAAAVGPARAQPFQVMDATIDDVKAALASKQITCRALVEQYLGRIDALKQSVLAMMADEKLDALAYATFDYPPPKIPADALTASTLDSAGPGNNRRLSPALGFPAITVPAGFTADGLPIGLELMGREFDEGLLLKLAYAYEQGTHHRRPPGTAPALASAR